MLALLPVAVRLVAGLPEVPPLQRAQGHTGCRRQEPHVAPPHRRWTAVAPWQRVEARAVPQPVAGYIAVLPEPERIG